MLKDLDKASWAHLCKDFELECCATPIYMTTLWDSNLKEWKNVHVVSNVTCCASLPTPAPIQPWDAADRGIMELFHLQVFLLSWKGNGANLDIYYFCSVLETFTHLFEQVFSVGLFTICYLSSGVPFIQTIVAVMLPGVNGRVDLQADSFNLSVRQQLDTCQAAPASD